MKTIKALAIPCLVTLLASASNAGFHPVTLSIPAASSAISMVPGVVSLMKTTGWDDRLASAFPDKVLWAIAPPGTSLLLPQTLKRGSQAVVYSDENGHKPEYIQITRRMAKTLRANIAANDVEAVVRTLNHSYDGTKSEETAVAQPVSEKAAFSVKVSVLPGAHAEASAAMPAEAVVVQPSAQISPVSIHASASGDASEEKYGMIVSQPNIQLYPGRAGYVQFKLYFDDGSFLNSKKQVAVNLAMDMIPCSAEYACLPGDSVVRFGKYQNPDGYFLSVSPGYVVVSKGAFLSRLMDVSMVVKTEKYNWLGMKKEILGSMLFTFNLGISPLH